MSQTIDGAGLAANTATSQSIPYPCVGQPIMPSPAYITTDDAGPKAVCPAKRRYELDTLSVITPQKAGLMNRILRRPPPSQDPYEIEEMKKAADAANGADATLKSFKSNPFAAHPDSDFKEMEGSLKRCITEGSKSF